MRSFKKFIKEGRGPHTSDQSRATDNGINTSDVQNPRAIRALNAYVGAIANMEYIIPEQALEKQTKDAIAMMNALQGAKQQCESFLKELNNGEPEVSDSSDVG